MSTQRNGLQDKVEEKRRSKWKKNNSYKDIKTETADEQEENKEESKTRTHTEEYK